MVEGPVERIKHDVRLKTGAKLSRVDALTYDLPRDLPPRGQPGLREG